MQDPYGNAIMHNLCQALLVRSLAVVAGTFVIGTSFPALADELPEEIQPPEHVKILFRLHAKGNQIYVGRLDEDTNKYAWKLKAPDALLFDQAGELFGKHYGGPSWEAKDGSIVTGEVAGSSPSPDAKSIPWLLVTIITHTNKDESHRIKGKMAKVAYVQRINTKGGKAPAIDPDSAHANQELRVPYSADYVFLAPGK